MFRLIQDYVVDGLKVSKGLNFKELPVCGVFGKIPREFFEEFKPEPLAKKKRAKKSTPKPTPNPSARISDRKI